VCISEKELRVKKLETRSWWPELVALKDEMSLRELSEKFGAAPAAISNALKRNGLSRKASAAGPRKARSTKTPKKPSRAGGSILAEYRDQMGKVVDRVIAEKAGVTVSAVTNYRKRHNIKASGSRGRPRTRPEQGKAIRRREQNGVHGYRVTIGGVVFVVLAKDITEAAMIARSSGRGVVTQIELVGKALNK
tara:strand:- start:26 stop:601 length:576 start_codon:yes stop_codon:yes gene_type:complete